MLAGEIKSECEAVLIYSPGAHIGCLVPVAQLLSQRLMECERTGLGAAVISHLTEGDKAGHGSNSDDMAVVGLDHGGEELLNHEEVGNGVDFKGLANLGLGLVEDSSIVTDTSVVDQNSGITVIAADGLSDLGDIGGGGDVGLVEEDIGWQSEIGLVNVENNHANTSLGQIFHDLLADTTASTSQEDEFARGHPFLIACPVLQSPRGESLVDRSHQTQSDNGGQRLLRNGLDQQLLGRLGESRQGGLSILVNEIEIGHDEDGGGG